MNAATNPAPPPLSALLGFDQFVVARLDPEPNGKTRKTPVHPITGRPANAQERSNWTPYTEALRAAHVLETQSGVPHAVGFVLTEADDFWCLDIDNCLQADAQWSPRAHQLITELAGCAVEVSQSGKGLHIWGRGTLPPHSCKADGLELYDRARFIVIGQGLTQGSPGATGSIASTCPGIQAVAAKHFPPRIGVKVAANDPGTFNGPCPEWRGPADDGELIARALEQSHNTLRAFQGKPRFRDLWDGEVPALARAFPSGDGRPYDYSAADMALAGDLAYWTGKDAPRIERLMRLSELERDKWDERPDYLQRTITNACLSKNQVLQDGSEVAVIPDTGSSDLFPLVPFADIGTSPPPPRKWVWDQLVPAGEVTLLGAHGGTGKSWLALMLAAQAAQGLPMFGKAVARSRVVILSAEDGPDTVRLRLRDVCQGLSVDPQALSESLEVWDGTQADPTLFAGQRGKPGAATAAGQAFAERLARARPGLLIVDNASDAYGGDEIDRRDVRAFVQFLARTVRPWGGAVLLLAHVNKMTSRAGGRPEDSESYSGSTAWHNSCRSRLFLFRGADGVLELRREKSNHADGPCPPMRFTGVLGGMHPVLLEAPAQMPPEAALLALLALMEQEHLKALALGQGWARLAPKPQSADDAIKTLQRVPGWPAGLPSKEAREILKSAEQTGALLRISVKREDRKPHDTWIPSALWLRQKKQSAPGALGVPG